MVRRIVLAVVVAVVVTLVCVLVGALLVTVNVDIATVVGRFLEHYSAGIGILAGIWYYFTRTSAIV